MNTLRSLVCEKVTHLKYYRYFWSFFIVLFALDQISKSIIINYLPHYSLINIPLIPPVLYFSHVHNAGAAWGILQGYSFYLALLGIIVLISIYKFRRTLQLKHISIQCSMGCLSAGILGNVIDRLAYGHVIDFIDVYIINYHWPTFNIADASITIGVMSYFISNLLTNHFKSKT